MEYWFHFTMISLLFIIIPGPDFFMIIRNTLSGSRKNGAVTILGSLCGHIVYAALAAMGLIFVLKSSTYIFSFIKIAGALYISYLGIKSFLRIGNTGTFTIKKTKEISLRISYKQGLLSTLLNPKVILFYLSVLPPFIIKNGSESFQVINLSLLFLSIVLIWFSICINVFNYIKYLFENSKVNNLFNGFVGTALIFIAISILKTKP
ncbi:LysE family translocator [Staphylococcus simulans]|uniref:LysE family translocator n=1 Tax=Staphylococcus simulans TaxID=1286 RepID=UPI0021D2E194|nr:LysE family translocator [Staphylococcus simulans]UXV43740.1 LysE family translocator [Staphylococcus simulans]